MGFPYAAPLNPVIPLKAGIQGLALRVIPASGSNSYRSGSAGGPNQIAEW